MPRPVRIGLLGDDDSDKSRLMITYVTSRYPSNQMSSNEVKDMSLTQVVDGKPTKIILFDFPLTGLSDEERLKYYEDIDIFLICFSLISPDTLDLTKKYLPDEIKRVFSKSSKKVKSGAKSNSGVKIPSYYLVGTNFDALSSDKILNKLKLEKISPISHYEASKVSEENSSIGYIEVSAANNFNVKRCFTDAARYVIHNRRLNLNLTGFLSPKSPKSSK